MQGNGTARRGFTLIELSMVLVVIGLIVGGTVIDLLAR
jgi:prepilin-type N-terminal cleavage/methylation domain-containing protein